MLTATSLRLPALRRAFSMFFNIDHEWINFNPKTKIGVVGITDYARNVLGEVIHIRMPEVGEKFKQGDVMGKVESTRVIDDIYCPLSGEVIEVNQNIIDMPDIINNDPEIGGWLLKLKLEDLSELEFLYDKPEYDKLVAQLKRKDSI